MSVRPAHQRVCHDLPPVPVLAWDEPHPVYGAVEFVSREVAHLCPECFEPVLSLAERLAAARQEVLNAMELTYDPALGSFMLTQDTYDRLRRAEADVEALRAAIDAREDVTLP